MIIWANSPRVLKAWRVFITLAGVAGLTVLAGFAQPEIGAWAFWLMMLVYFAIALGAQHD